MTKKRWVAAAAIMSMVLTVPIGCQGTSAGSENPSAGSKDSSQEDLVVPKNQESTVPAQTAKGGNIAEQVQAPDAFELQFSDESGKIEVEVKARVVVPEADGFRLKTVTSRIFTQEDYDAVNQVLLQGGKLWDRVVDENDPAHGFTKSEIEERIRILKEEKESGESYVDQYGDGKDYDKKIAEFEAMLEAAPETARIKEIEPKVRFDSKAEENGDPDNNMLMGYVTMDGKDYFTVLDNNISPAWRWISFSAEYSENGGNYMPVGIEGSDTAQLKTSPADIEQRASSAVEEMGLTDFQYCGGEYFASYTEEKGRMVPVDYSYGVHFTRVIDGIPVTYTNNDGTTVEDNNASWPYEHIYLAYNDEGLTSFRWTDPYTVTDMSDEYVFLMPFEEIQKIFKEMILKKNSDFAQAGLDFKFHIEEIRLGYMRIMEKGNPTEGTMIPVWDFLGTKVIHYNNTEEPFTDSFGGPFESCLTINAMDGTVIDRDLGY